MATLVQRAYLKNHIECRGKLTAIKLTPWGGLPPLSLLRRVWPQTEGKKQMENDLKQTVFKFRLTEAEKEKLRLWAQAHSISMSEAIRQLCEEIFKN